MDIVLLLICKNVKMLFCGILGGLLGGLVPGLGGSLGKYDTALKELKGVGNFVIVLIIFCIMLFMIATIAYPELFREINWKWDNS